MPSPQTLLRPIHLRYKDGEDRERTLTVAQERYAIGRDATCQFRPRDGLVSRRHAEIFRDGDQAFLHDLDSRNGTWLNGERVFYPAPLQDGDQIAVGRVQLTVQMEESHEESSGESLSENEISSWLFLKPVDEPAPQVPASRTDEARVDGQPDPRP